MANIEHLLFIQAPAAKVYEALTTERGLAEVWTRELSVSRQIGDTLTFRFGPDEDRMRLTELAPDRRVVWECVESDPQWVGTTIVFELEERSGKTSVKLGHLNWREVTPFYWSCNYNWAMFLYSLKLYVEKGKGMNYQSRVSQG